MADVEIVIELPEALVDRAKALGLRIDEQSEFIAQAVERDIKKREETLNETQLAAMADDPDIQREITLIREEFTVTESDG